MRTDALNREAVQIMKSNDRGGYTVPTARLYPYQWNWDSAFAALGFATFDRPRAWREIEMLFEGQWVDGMIPHIIFRRDDPDYFPGPGVWQTDTTPPTTGHSQPPVIASVVRRLVESGGAFDVERARALYPKLMAYHRWFHAARDPAGTGVVAVVHPWESGRDNCPDWDAGMAGIEIAPDLEDYVRRDTAHVDASERPSKDQYDKFLTLIRDGRALHWDQREIAARGQFFVADPGIQFILLRADRDLLILAEQFGTPADRDLLRGWIAQSDVGSASLWNEKAGGFTARDLRSGTPSPGLSSASFLAFWAGTGTPDQRHRLSTEARRIGRDMAYMLPSWDPGASGFEPRRYWRGPIWLVVNYLVAEGFAEAGMDDLAVRIREDSRKLIEQAGFYEYFNPLDGEGLGGGAFTWTAAIWLAWASPSPESARQAA
ncbi:MAG: hypothetical protein AAF638_04930 [Pseudomonadota bacterium]